MMKVSIFGLGYVGCVTAGCLARDGHTIVGVDLDPEKANNLANGKPTVVEDGLEALIAEAHQAGRLTATRDSLSAVRDTEVSFICVGTPNTAEGDLDMRAVRATAESITDAVIAKDADHLVVLRSTVPTGTCENLLIPIFERANKGRKRIRLVIVPEFLRESTAIADNDDPPFVVVGNQSGVPDESEPIIESLFGNTPKKVDWLSYGEAELLKATCNVFHAVKVAYGNEIGSLCSRFSINGQRLMAQFVKDEKLNISPYYLRPGLPFGGSCLPKDTRMMVSLAKKRGLSLPLLESLLPSNEEHLKRAIGKIPANSPTKVGLYGLAFKSGTDDLRESPIVLIAEYLIGKGFDVRIYDESILESTINGTNKTYIENHIPHLSKRLVSTMEELVDHADLVLSTRNHAFVEKHVLAGGKAIKLIDLEGNKADLIVQPEENFEDAPTEKVLVREPVAALA